MSPKVLLAGLLLVLVGCSGEQLPALPQSLWGEWRTAEARYQGRSIRLEAHRVTFGMGGAAPDTAEQVEVVRVASADRRTEYEIRLLAPDGTPDLLTLDFTQENGGELHLKSQPKIAWKLTNGTIPKAGPTPPAPTVALPLSGIEHKTIYKIDCIHQHECRSY